MHSETWYEQAGKLGVTSGPREIPDAPTVLVAAIDWQVRIGLSTVLPCFTINTVWTASVAESKQGAREQRYLRLPMRFLAGRRDVQRLSSPPAAVGNQSSPNRCFCSRLPQRVSRLPRCHAHRRFRFSLPSLPKKRFGPHPPPSHNGPHAPKLASVALQFTRLIVTAARQPQTFQGRPFLLRF